jgi:hypothetical protein
MAIEKQTDRYEILLKVSENLANTVTTLKDDVSGIRKEISEMKTVVNRLPGDSRMQLNIKTRATKKVVQILGNPKNPLFKKTISNLWHDFWQAFAVTTYKDTPAALYDEAISFIDRWKPMELVGLEEPKA